MSQSSQYLIKFPSSKRFFPSTENQSKNDDNQEYSDVSPNIIEESKDENSFNEHSNQNDRNSFWNKIGFMNKKNLSFHTKFESNEKPKTPSCKYEEMKTEKLLKKITILEEENSILQKINNFSEKVMEESELLKKKVNQFSKEMEQKSNTIDTLNNEISYIKEKFENEFFSEPKDSKNSLNISQNVKKNDNTPRNSVKILELLNDNKNLLYVVKDLSENYNKMAIKIKSLEVEKQILQDKIDSEIREKENFKSKMMQIMLPNFNENLLKSLSFPEFFNYFADYANNHEDKSFLKVPYSSTKNSSNKKKKAEISLLDEEYCTKMEKKTNIKINNNREVEIKLKEKNINEINPINDRKSNVFSTNIQKFKYNSKENFYVKKSKTPNHSENSSNLKIYHLHKASSSKNNLKNY